jgi:hypothetical protein
MKHVASTERAYYFSVKRSDLDYLLAVTAYGTAGAQGSDN